MHSALSPSPLALTLRISRLRYRPPQIFAASKLVIANKRIVDTAMFKSLSMTAEGWVPIEEVSEPELLPWLQARSREGYEIVGLEQTADSQSIEVMQRFARKTYVTHKSWESVVNARARLSWLDRSSH